jgi:hypothetical protein
MRALGSAARLGVAEPLWAFISAKSGRAAQRDIEDVWTAIVLHTTPGMPEHTRPTIALVAAGVEVDVLGIAYHHAQATRACARIIRASRTSRKASSITSRKASSRSAYCLRQREGRCAGAEGPQLQEGEPLLDHPRLGLTELISALKRGHQSAKSEGERQCPKKEIRPL